MGTFRYAPRGRFSLEAAGAFVDSFVPFGHRARSADQMSGPVVLALLADDWQPTVVRLWQTEKSVMANLAAGTADPGVVRAQVARMLSIDLDGRPYDRLDDPPIARLRTAARGLRPVLFPTPYEAACWAVLTQRTRMQNASTMSADLRDRRGAVVSLDGVEHRIFPSPQQLLDTRTLDGASDTKVERLHSVALAALDGRLDAGALRDADVDQAVDGLRCIEGIGPFGAELILVRGAGSPDVFPSAEPRLHRAMTELYGVDDPTIDDLRRIAEAWRPRRSWVSFLIRSQHRPNQGGTP